ncbi:rhodanese-like domain-containing protein [Salinimicrobium oceani]|uniref:Rhodanese-like domain-containing protein n=1 Tax=Salinimicrobium oceani TaxID=2722702 RepID=A0ABX1CWC7_9FLAO|nr:rhodanese-like domain-containing protein [Salinimicrobium oceani]NJW52600.1 rhodanese-like domain-containing protein [Salinimicrobium oceani]
MLNTLINILGIGSKPNFSELLKEGAMIIDVRTKREFETGHIPGSRNIPLDTLPVHLKKLGDKQAAIITCCASGMRSASARNLLKSAGFERVYNGGGWKNLNNKLK